MPRISTYIYAILSALLALLKKEIFINLTYHEDGLFSITANIVIQHNRELIYHVKQREAQPTPMSLGLPVLKTPHRRLNQTCMYLSYDEKPNSASRHTIFRSWIELDYRKVGNAL